MSNKPETTAKIADKQVRQSIARMSTAELKNTLDKFDDDIKALVNTTLEQLGPGKPFNPALVRNIAKIEARKHRLLSMRLVALLKQGHPGVKEIVDHLITLEV